ncbi:MAG: hypothetical protein HXL58_03045 [Solobacterium sp.]|nr:hypothetical protein [Solobacterium sp.]
MNRELILYQSNPEKYIGIIKSISELKTTKDKEKFLNQKRKLLMEGINSNSKKGDVNEFC